MKLLLSTSLVLSVVTGLFFATEKSGKLVDQSKVTYNVGEDKQLNGAYKIEDASNVLRLRGSYTANKRAGDWYCFNAAGKMVMRYNYTVGKLLSLEQAELAALEIQVIDKNKEVTTGASIPLPVVSIEQYKKLLVEELKDQIPAKERVGKVEVTAEITALVSAKGDAKYIANYSINGIDNKLVIYLKDKLFDLEWIPAKYNDKTYKSEVKFSTSFQMDSASSSSKRFVWTF